MNGGSTSFATCPHEWGCCRRLKTMGKCHDKVWRCCLAFICPCAWLWRSLRSLDLSASLVCTQTAPLARSAWERSPIWASRTFLTTPAFALMPWTSTAPWRLVLASICKERMALGPVLTAFPKPPSRTLLSLFLALQTSLRLPGSAHSVVRRSEVSFRWTCTLAGVGGGGSGLCGCFWWAADPFSFSWCL